MAKEPSTKDIHTAVSSAGRLGAGLRTNGHGDIGLEDVLAAAKLMNVGLTNDTQLAKAALKWCQDITEDDTEGGDA